jgi:hypothetical protein
MYLESDDISRADHGLQIVHHPRVRVAHVRFGEALCRVGVLGVWVCVEGGGIGGSV